MIGILLLLTSALITVDSQTCLKDGLIPDEKNCSVFYICSAGIPYQVACADGLHFNAKDQVCDWPKNAGCKVKEPITSTEIENTEYTTVSTDYTTVSTVYTTFSTAPNTNVTYPFKCSVEDEGKMSEHPEDCQVFFICSNQEWHEFLCPNNTHYNAKIMVCDWPENAGCSATMSNLTDNTTASTNNINSPN